MAHHPRKRFGQHFLHDQSVIAKIITAIAPQTGQHIVEIGPGLGAITLPLLERCQKLRVVEIDRDAASELSRRAGTSSGLEIIVADALRTDFCALADSGQIRVVGNLPYNISTPLLFHLLDQLQCIADMHFMLQKEVVARMAACPGGKQYGRLTVMLALRCRVEPLFDIGSGAFRPPPRVASSFVRLVPDDRHWRSVQDVTILTDLVRQAFSMRRKTLRRSLGSLLGSDDFQLAGVDAGDRPERLTAADFVRLANAVTKKGGARL